MPEPITTTVAVIALLKTLVAKGVLAKVVLATKGLGVLHGKGVLLLAHKALLAAKAYGVTEAAHMVAQMLIILGSVSAGTVAVVLAIEALEAASEGDFKEALKTAAKAVREGNPVVKVWWPS